MLLSIHEDPLYTLTSHCHHGWEGDVLVSIFIRRHLLPWQPALLYVCECHMGHAAYLRLSRKRTCSASSLWLQTCCDSLWIYNGQSSIRRIHRGSWKLFLLIFMAHECMWPRGGWGQSWPSTHFWKVYLPSLNCLEMLTLSQLQYIGDVDLLFLWYYQYSRQDTFWHGIKWQNGNKSRTSGNLVLEVGLEFLFKVQYIF